MNQGPPGDKGPSPMRYAGLGVQLAATLLAGVFIGQWADRKLHTGSLLTILGAFIGFGGTMYSLIRQLGKGGQGGQDGKDGQGGRGGREG